MSFVEKIVNWIRVRVLDMNSISLVESDVLEVKQFVAECMNIADRAHKDDLVLNIPNSETVHNLWVKGNKLLDKYSKRETAELRLQIQNQMGYISKVRARFVEANLLTLGSRQPPLCVLIRGASGVGKSETTIPLVTGALSMVLPEDQLNDFRANYESFIYGRQSEHVYWDGYRGQFVCAFDDFGQLKDVAGQGENEFSEFIRAGNVFGFILHMADIESKGGVAFRSKIVICTTNLQRIQPESIVQPEAVTRRFDIEVQQVPPVEYCTRESLETGDLWERRLDSSKVHGTFDEKACEFHVLKTNKGDCGSGRPTGEVLTYDGFVNLMVNAYEKREKHAALYKISLEQNVARFLEKRNDRVFKDPQLFYQMNIDDEFESSGSLSSNEDEVGLSLVTDPAILAFLSKGVGNPAVGHLMNLVQHLQKKIGVLHMDQYDFLSQLIRGSRVVYSRTNEWYQGQLSGDLYDFEKLVVLVTVFVSELTANDAKCKYVYEHLNVRLCSTVVQSWKQALNRFSGWCESYLERIVQVFSRFPRLQWFMSAVPFGEFILAFVAHAAAGMFTLATVQFALRGIKTLLGFIFPSLFIEVVGEEGAEILKTTRVLPKHFKPHVETQSATKARPAHKVSREYVRSMRNKSRLQPKLDTQLGSTDPVLDMILTKVIENNCYELWINDKQKSGYITFVKGRVALMPWHFATELAAQIEKNPEIVDDFCYLKKARSSIQFAVRISVLLEGERATSFGSQDACLVKFPREIKNHLDITKYFHSEKSANMKRDKKFVLHFPNVDRIQEWHGDHYEVRHNVKVGLTPENESYVRLGYFYRSTTNKGDCGAIMSAVDPSSGREKIIGIHTGGNQLDAHGFSTAICREDLLETLDLFSADVVSTLYDTEPVIDYNADFKMLDGRFVTLGTTEKVVRASEYTAIGPSKLIGEWQPPQTIPGRLKPFSNEEGALIDPFKVGLAKYCKPHVLIDPELMAIIGGHVLQDLQRASLIDVDKNILSFEEAVKGMENEPDFGSLPRGTSPGYPHNVDPNKSPGKTKWFGKDQLFDLSGDACHKLKKDVEEIISSARWEIRQPFFYCDYLKDERRTHKKHAEGNTRIFSACPLEYSIAVRMYFGAFSLWMIKNKIANGSAIGVNPYSFDWQRLATDLKEHGPKVGAGDYKGFDGSEQPEIHWAILDIINKWYDDGQESARIRSMLWLELVNSRHIRGNLVYEWVSSLPSGHPLTTLVNILYGFFAFRYCWYRAYDNDVMSLFQFPKNVKLVELGDDNIFNFSDACSEVFNQETIGRFMAEIGLTYTDEDKQTGSIVKWRTLEECTFLKRGFRVEKVLDRYVGPLSLDSLLESPYWTTKNAMKDSITKTTTETCLLELALHDEATWKQWSGKIINAYNRHYFDKLECTDRLQLILKSDCQENIW
jgi:hypothetical protein